MNRRVLALGVLQLSLILPAGARAQTEVKAPADGWIVFTSTRANGRAELFRCRADGSDVVQITDAGGTFPRWSPDGRWLSYHDEAGGVFLMRPDGSEKRQLPFPQPDGASAFWRHDNSGLVSREPSGNVYLYDPDTLEKTYLFKVTDFPNRGGLFHLYSMTHDNRFLFVASDIFTDGFTVANGTFKTGYSAILIDLLDHNRMYMVGSGCWPFTPPEGDLVYHIRGDNDTWPDVYRMNLADLNTRSSYAPELAHPDADWGHEYHPHISNDNKWLVYMTSNGCHWDLNCNNEIFLHRLGDPPSERTRVTNHEAFDAFPDIHIGPLWEKSSEPLLVAAPNRLTFFARDRAVPASQTIKLKRDGGGTLAVAQAVADPAARWLEVKTGDAGVTVSLRQAALLRGRHQATITLTVDGATGSPLTIPVTLDADDSFPAAAPQDPDGGAPADAAVVSKPKSSGCSVGGGASPAMLLLAALALLGLRRRERC
jgi:MYXO-CTERM domain-containing protein